MGWLGTCASLPCLSVSPSMARGYMRAHVSLCPCYWVFSRYVSGLMINTLYLSTSYIRCTLDISRSGYFKQPIKDAHISPVRAKHGTSFCAFKAQSLNTDTQPLVIQGGYRRSFPIQHGKRTMIATLHKKALYIGIEPLCFKACPFYLLSSFCMLCALYWTAVYRM